MRKISLLLFLFSGLCISASAEDAYDFHIIQGINNRTLQNTMESNAKALFKVINEVAKDTTKTITVSQRVATTKAIEGIQQIWKHSYRFRFEGSDSVYCSKKNTGYETRHIIVSVIPLDGNWAGNLKQEIRLDYNSAGTITAFVPTLPWQSVERIRRTGIDLSPNGVNNREKIIEFTEKLQDFYSSMKLDSIKMLFDPNAIIVVGKQITTRTGTHTTFVTMDAEKYFVGLGILFDKCKTITVRFDKYNVLQDDENPNLYVVTFEQDWHSKYKNGHVYKDFGYVCLLWDFSGDDPVITFRSWQPKDKENEKERISLHNIREYVSSK